MRALILGTLLFALAGCSGNGPTVQPSPQPVVVTLRVVVVDAATVAPIAGATARIDPSLPQVTDASGVTSFKIVAADLPQTHLWVSAPGYRGHDQHIDVGGRDQTVVAGLRRETEPER